jgi:hypothetical protein
MFDILCFPILKQSIWLPQLLHFTFHIARLTGWTSSIGRAETVQSHTEKCACGNARRRSRASDIAPWPCVAVGGRAHQPRSYLPNANRSSIFTPRHSLLQRMPHNCRSESMRKNSRQVSAGRCHKVTKPPSSSLKEECIRNFRETSFSHFPGIPFVRTAVISAKN